MNVRTLDDYACVLTYYTPAASPEELAACVEAALACVLGVDGDRDVGCSMYDLRNVN